MYDQLTAKEQEELRRTMHRGNQAAFRLAAFASGHEDLFAQAYGTATEVAAIHAELCDIQAGRAVTA